MEHIVAIVAIIMTFATPVLCLALVTYNLQKRRQMQMEVIDKLLASGQPIPDSLFQAATPGNDLDVLYRRSLYLSAIGATSFIALLLLAGIDVAALALIPTAVGAVKYKLWRDSVSRQTAQAPTPEQGP